MRYQRAAFPPPALSTRQFREFNGDAGGADGGSRPNAALGILDNDVNAPIGSALGSDHTPPVGLIGVLGHTPYGR